jgi:hypothetical protein
VILQAVPFTSVACVILQAVPFTNVVITPTTGIPGNEVERGEKSDNSRLNLVRNG